MRHHRQRRNPPDQNRRRRRNPTPHRTCASISAARSTLRTHASVSVFSLIWAALLGSTNSPACSADRDSLNRPCIGRVFHAGGRGHSGVRGMGGWRGLGRGGGGVPTLRMREKSNRVLSPLRVSDNNVCAGGDNTALPGRNPPQLRNSREPGSHSFPMHTTTKDNGRDMYLCTCAFLAGFRPLI